MKQYSFSIRGTQEDPYDNPIPKLRKTLRQQWTPEAQRYAAWKAFVQKSFLDSLMQIDFNVHLRILRVFKKPLKLGPEDKAVMDIRIFWKDDKHGDPENVFGSIADALFYNDKNLDGSFKSEISGDKKGRVEIIISFNTNGKEQNPDSSSEAE